MTNLNQSIDILELSIRSMNALKKYTEINTIDKFINSIYIFNKILIYEDDVLLDLIKYYIKIIEKHKKNSCNLLFTIKYDYDFWCNDYKTLFNKELYSEW